MATKRHFRKCILVANLIVALVFLSPDAHGKKKPPVDEPPFEYVAGTEDIQPHCHGKLELLKDSLVFGCLKASAILPYSAITLMQYRPALSPKVARMKLDWKVRPTFSRAKNNQYLTLLYNEKDGTHAIILKVAQPAMRPYLAEIELRTGKSVQVWRSYDEDD